MKMIGERGRRMTVGTDDGARPRMSAGERPLLAFVSSIMREAVEADLLPAREEVVRTFRRAASLFDLWAFEFTPASSEWVDRGYLRKVREADIVLWLVGRETTPAVADEIREALAANRRLVVVRLPTTRSDATEALLHEVGLRAKYADGGGPNTLADVLTLTIGDEIIRAMRGRPDLGRLERLEEMGRASRGRSLDRWQANGLPRAQADELIRDTSLGALGADLHVREPGVILLVGEMGAGKSLVGERFIQAAIAGAASHSDAPIPVYLEARDAAGRLQAAVQGAAEGLGNPRIQGAAIVVDGLDEAGVEVAEPLLREARVLAETWPQTTIVLTSRPMPALDRSTEKIAVPLLDDTKANALISRAAQRELPHGFSLSPSVQDAVRRPLFAILVGVYLREQGVAYVRSAPELLDTLVERAIGQAVVGRASADVLFHRLAVASVDRGGAAVPTSDVGRRDEVAALLATRLVVEHDGALTFPLALLTQWFAAQSLATGTMSVEDILSSTERLERWRYPLTILVGTMGHDTVTRVFAPIAARFPGFAARIVRESLPDRSNVPETQLPPAEECGTRVHATMVAWSEGMGPLAPYTVPLREDGAVATLAVATGSNGWLTAAWRRGQEALPDVVDFATHYTEATPWSNAWPSWRSGPPLPQSAWAWRWTFDELSKALTHIVDRHTLPLPDGPLRDEATWRLARTIAGKGSLSHDPVLVADLEAMMAPYAAYTRVHFNGNDLNPQTVLSILAALRASGVDRIRSPWPGPDLLEEERRPNWVWAPYSDERLLARAQAIYAAALQGYQQIVATWFPMFAPHLQLAVRLPLRRVGVLQPQRRDAGMQGAPVLWGDWEPLPRGKRSEMNFRLIRPDETTEDGSAIRTAVPENWHALTDIYEDTPATDLAYGWLASDLRRLRWL